MITIEASSVSKLYRKSIFRRSGVQALNDVSLKVEPGQIYGLLGPNGAGKTTFVKILLNIVKPTNGSTRIYGIPSSNCISRKRVGYLPENHKYPDYMTPQSMLHFMGRLYGLDKQTRVQRMCLLLEQIGLAQEASLEVNKFSKGMLQRLGLAQALLSDPDLVVLDEPTGGVDPVGRKEIRDILIDLKNRGKTVFLNSHLLSEVEMICDKVAILKEGRLLKEGAVSDLTRQSHEYRLELRTVLEDYLAVLGSNTTDLDGDRRRFRVKVNNVEDLDRIIDLLRDRKIGIDAILPERESLEDLFLKTLKGNG